MLSRFHTLVLLAGGVLLAACADSPDTTPMSPDLQIGSTCSPSNITKYAKALAGTGSQVYKYAQQFTNQNANSIFATNLFFDLAAEAADLARVRPPATELTDAQRTALANLLIQGIACADVVISDASYSGLNYVSTFESAAGSTGMLEVRGRNSDDNGIVFSHNKGSHGSAGVKAPSAGFSEWWGGKVMFYGFPIDPFSAETSPKVAYEVFTIRPSSNKHHPTLRGLVAICVAAIVDDPAQFRIQKGRGGAATILPVPEGESFDLDCPETIGMGSEADQSGSAFGNVMTWLQRKLLPEPLHATSFLLTVKPAGSAKTLSPLEAVNPGSVTLTYAPGPVDGQVKKPLGVIVHAAAAKGTGWEGLLIEIKAQDNNGNFVTVDPKQATTDASGNADFTKSIINKTGVYQLLAYTVPSDADLGQFTPDSVLSGNFLQRPR